MTADLRAEVLAGIDRALLSFRVLCDQSDEGMLFEKPMTDALRLLREMAEKHKMLQNADMAWCDGCGAEDECPILISLARVYAPDALKEKPDAD